MDSNNFDGNLNLETITDEQIKEIIEAMGISHRVSVDVFRKQYQEFRAKANNAPSGLNMSSAFENVSDVTMAYAELLDATDSGTRIQNATELAFIAAESATLDMIYALYKAYNESFPIIINIAAINDKDHPEHVEGYFRFLKFSLLILSKTPAITLAAMVSPEYQNFTAAGVGILRQIERNASGREEELKLFQETIHLSVLTNMALRMLSAAGTVNKFMRKHHSGDKPYHTTIEEGETYITVDVAPEIKAAWEVVKSMRDKNS